MYSNIQQRKKQKEVIYIVWLQTYQHLTRCKTGLIMHPIMAQTKKERVWVSNPLKTCLRHKIPMTLVEFFHRYWLSLSGEWSSVNIKYGLLWSSTPWYGGLWQGDQKPPKPNSSPIFYQLFSYGSCRTMYLRWVYINKECSFCKSDCMLLTGGNGTIAKLFAQQGKNQSRGSKCTTTQLLGTCWDFLIFGDIFFCCNALSRRKNSMLITNCLCVD